MENGVLQCMSFFHFSYQSHTCTSMLSTNTVREWVRRGTPAAGGIRHTQYRTCTGVRSVSHFTSSSLISLPLPLKRLTKITCLYCSPINTIHSWCHITLSALQKRKRCNRAMILTNFCTHSRSLCSHFRSRLCRAGPIAGEAR